MFYIAQAVLMTKNVTASSHQGVIRLFGQHFGKTNIFDPQTATSLPEAYRKRLIGDYAVGVQITQEEAKELLVSARKFVEALKNYLKKETGEEY